MDFPTHRDPNQIVVHEHDENLNAKRVIVVGGSLPSFNISGSSNVEKEIVYVDKPFVVEKIVYKEIEVPIIVEKIKEIDKPIYKEIEKIVYVDKPIIVEKEVIKEVDKPILIEKNEKIEFVDKPIVVEKEIFLGIPKWIQVGFALQSFILLSLLIKVLIK